MGALRLRLAWCAVSLAVAGSGCANEATTGPLLPAALTLEAGDGQAGYAAQPLTNSLVVKVADAGGAGLPGVAVQWRVLTGGGSVSASSSLTDSAGLASVDWTLGPADAPNTASAVANGLPAVVFSATGIIFRGISAGAYHTCTWTARGAVYCWPGRGRTAPTVVPTELIFAAVGSGYAHDCGVTTGGAAYCWGTNSYGELGNPGSAARSDTPVPVYSGLAFATVSAADYHSCGVTTGGGAYCWGSNAAGQLGDGTTAPGRSSPVAVAGGLTFESVSAAGYSSCGVTTGNAAYCWGYNNYGQLGDGSFTNRGSPALVAGGLSFAAVSAGSLHSCGVTTAGAVYCWGSNTYGELGDGSTNDSPTPVSVSGGLTFEAVSVGIFASCGLTTGGAAHCWGDNGYGELGDGSTDESHTPVQVSGGLTFAGVTTGNVHACGVTTGGTVYCWGSNTYGQLGSGPTTGREVCDFNPYQGPPGVPCNTTPVLVRP
jgi:hypothetical protein